MDLDEDQAEQGSLNSSPLALGEARTNSCRELKLHTTQTQREIDLQLKANLMLAMCHTFVDSVDASRSCEQLRKMKQLTGYGLSFGTESDCVVYKLVLDFERNESTFLERFRYQPGMSSPVIINSAVSYILNRMS